MRLWPQQGDSGANLAAQTGLPHFMTGPCGSPAQTCNPPGTGLATFLLVCLPVPRSRAFPLSWAKVLRGRGWNVTWLMNHLLLAGGHSRPVFSLLPPSPAFPFGGKDGYVTLKITDSDSHHLWGADLEPGSGRLRTQLGTQTRGFKSWLHHVLTWFPGEVS